MFDLHQGVEFRQYITGKPLMLKELEGGEVWICYKHPDGPWVTLRKATSEEVSIVRRSIERKPSFSIGCTALQNVPD